MAATEGGLLTYAAAVDAGQREVAWYYGELGRSWQDRDERVSRAAQAIEGTLHALRPPERGTLALRYTRREWPALVRHAYGPWASLVVRRECSLHDWDGRSTTLELERRAAERIEAHIHGLRDPALAGLSRRARECFRKALHAYVARRGRSPSLLPDDARASQRVTAA
jgi:hypothetical protein